MKIHSVFIAAAAIASISSEVAFSQDKYVSCPWNDGEDYYVYKIDDLNEKFEFTPLYIESGPASFYQVVEKDNAILKVTIIQFSKQKIEHCSLLKSRESETCYILNRISGNLTTERRGKESKTVSCSAGLPAAKF